MKVIGLMLARSEDWVLGLSLRVALRWCDEVILYAHNTQDSTFAFTQIIAKEFPNRLFGKVVESEFDKWDEMDVRQHMLEDGRIRGGTHFAIVDADEILTHNALTLANGWFRHLEPGQLLEVPMVPVCEGFSKFRTDNPWHNRWLTTGFMDAPQLSWKPAMDGYQHHNRPPYDCLPEPLRPLDQGQGGVMHIQFANKRRLLAKHVLYRMVDHLRWPGRRSPARLNSIYDDALKTPSGVALVPDIWLGDYDVSVVKYDSTPWHEEAVVQLLKKHGRSAFDGLDLKGY